MMPANFLSLAASQAAQIAMVAILVAAVVRLWAKERPHLAHALWALVLLKCLTPPVIPSPIHGVFGRETSVAKRQELAELHLASSVQTSVRVSEGTMKSEVPVPRGSRSERDANRGRDSWQIWLLGAWGLSSGALLAGFVFQFARFKKLVRNTMVAVPASVECEMQRLSCELQIHWPVRVVVLDALIGPAVMGCLRPTLLLPKAIVDDCRLDELRVLLAHELVHIRRGDLFWSAVQVLALSLWWFHPAIWLANRLLIREAERSCDEETISNFGFKPIDYANSLLSVIETKQRLDAAPIVPGLRPVDITSKRMERIMRIGQGSHSRTPRWVNLTMLVGAVLLLPGSVWLRAQDKEKTAETPRDPAAVFPSPQATQAPPTATPGPLHASETPTSKAAVTEDESSANSLTLQFTIMEVPLEVIQELRASAESAEKAGSVGDQNSPVNRLDAEGNVPGNAPRRLPRHPLLRGEKDDSGDVVGSGEDKRLLPGLGSVIPASASEPLMAPARTGDNALWLPNLSEVELIQQWAQHPDKFKVRLLSAPQITMLSGKRANVEVGQQHPFVSGLEKNGNPIVDVKNIGISCEAEATLVRRNPAEADFAMPESTDQDYVKIVCKVSHSEVIRVDEFTIKSADGKPTKIQQPAIASRMAEFALSLPLGGTCAATCGEKVADGARSTLLFLVTVDKAKPNQAKWEKNSTDKYLLHSNYSTSGEPKQQVARYAGQEFYTRLSMVGPTTAKMEKIDPPTDAQILAAFHEWCQDQQPQVNLGDIKSYRIQKVAIADYVDPPRFVPLLGIASLHHRHYKCALVSAEADSGPTPVIYVDHNHYQMLGE